MTLRRNPVGWTHSHKTVGVPGTAEHLPSLVVPDGFSLVVRALPGNTQNIYLGKSKSLAEDVDERLTYSKGNGLTLQVQNASSIWVDAEVAGEGVDFWCEI